MGRLSGKTALITGAAGEIGKTAAHRFVDEGAQVFLLDHNQQALEQMMVEFPEGKASHMVCDISNSAQMKMAFDTAKKLFHKLDIVVLNAAVEGAVLPITDYPEADFDHVMNVNVKGTWLGLKYAVGAMLESGGSIMALSSVAGLRGIARSSPYVASKHAVIGLVKTVAAEVGSKGLRVNVICPSPVESRMMRSMEEGAAPGASEKAKGAFEKMMLLRRYAKPEEVSNMMLFLASDESQFCTGGTYTVDGGYTTT